MNSAKEPFQRKKRSSYLFALEKPFQMDAHPEDGKGVPALWFLFHNDHLVLAEKAESLKVPISKTPPVPFDDMVYQRFIGAYDGSPCMAAEIRPTAPLSSGLKAVSLRSAYGYLALDLWTIAGRAVQILTWRKENRFCGRCGAVMQEQTNEVVSKCPECRFVSYPRLSPAVIVSVIKDNAILLGRAPRFPQGMYSVLAGFVEPGETLEEAVMREVMEEVGIRIADVRYMGSQPWPFPHSLMIGFTAKYEKGIIRVNQGELEDADWFTPDTMPPIPPAMSIARQLIDHFLRLSQND